MSLQLLGPQSSSLGAGVELERDAGVLRLVATRDLTDLSTGAFGKPSSYVSFRPSAATAAPQTRLGGYSWAQFALPVSADADLGFRFEHGNALVSPPVVFPLFAHHPQLGACLLAPLDRFHEQVVGVADGELRWGWHGDLDRVPSGFSTTLGLFEGASIRDLLQRWGRSLRERSGVAPTDRYADETLSFVSYWTDNGAAYWYRTEPGVDLQSTLETKCAELAELGVPIRAVELDSWFYPHERSRPIQQIGYLDSVPPTGMLAWEPREDVLPDGVAGLRERLGGPTLILHSRHISSASRYVEPSDDWWVHHGLAHPRDPAFFERFMRDAAGWGASCYEQDWLWIIWFGMAPLRAEPDRAHLWQSALDAQAARHGLSLIWCMATPADFAEATRLPRVAALRTCDDYRYADDPARLWTWFLVVNAMAAALGLCAFKDVFFSARGHGIDGDPHPEIEAMLSALSTGPVGIGDRIGRTDPAIVRRTCRADGLLVKPDRPLAALDGCLLGEPQRGERLLWADTVSGHWRYLVALHVADSAGPIRDGLDLEGIALVYDWRSASARVAQRVEANLGHRDWALWLICPVEDGCALIGDPERYAAMGDRRIRQLGRDSAEVSGAPGESVTVRWWTEADGLLDVRATLDASGRARVRVPERAQAS